MTAGPTINCGGVITHVLSIFSTLLYLLLCEGALCLIKINIIIQCDFLYLLRKKSKELEDLRKTWAFLIHKINAKLLSLCFIHTCKLLGYDFKQVYSLF